MSKSGSIYKNEMGRKIITNHYDKYLSLFPYEIHKEYVDTSYGRTNVLITGPIDGKPLIILQGGNCINPMTLSWFTPLMDTYRIYAPDTIGHPGYSDERRISATDESFAIWISDIMEHFHIKQSAFVGPSYGAGIILRVASYMPEKIKCAVLVSPAGISLGSKFEMVKKVLIPLMLFRMNTAEKHLKRITDRMSANTMKNRDRTIIGDIFKHIKLEQEMPKLTEKSELTSYNAPTFIISGKSDLFFPEHKLKVKSEDIINNLIAFTSMEMGHYPSEENLVEINEKIKRFLHDHY
ncbi:alpha/beta fold hydrolase [Pseudalkalibacillus berkeleyi]|uniref:Alpha/beta hydrolase n=1 Tax=Pseudalkalibacillus berkeleyi TaxID=1069813 RepID=A0ABS9GXJ5_9BACL|nr:alpha/beta hydrolase [Pseudalkalibacillus berkeleyi]MCF6137507.1 alpha/beta hydrolase [Pseudalkalibacillus berkeleyi]